MVNVKNFQSTENFWQMKMKCAGPGEDRGE